MDVFSFLKDQRIPFEAVRHEPVYTVEQAKKLVPELRGRSTKNLFVRNKKGRNHYLIVVGYDKSVDLKMLSKQLGDTRLSLASPERLMKYLRVEPGSVSLLAILNDVPAAVEVVIDRDLWQSSHLKCHPLINTSTLSIAREDVEKILDFTGHDYQILDIPHISVEKNI